MKYVRLTLQQVDQVHELAHSTSTFVALDKQSLENGDILVLIAERKKNGVIFINWVSQKRYDEMIASELPF